MKNFLKKSNIYLMKIQISFVCKKKKKIRSAFNENTNQFLELKKKLDLYLMKVQINFVCKKKNQICI